MGIDIDFLQKIGLDTMMGMEYTGGWEKYISMLQRFYKSFEKNRDKLDEYYTNMDLENYMILVHALKSTSLMIGATSLSSAFEDLEIAAREKDIDTIEKETVPAIANYCILVDKLKPVGEMEQVKAADEISGETAKETADELMAALDDFDCELSKELANKLMGYPFRIHQRDRLGEAIGLIDDFMYDEALEIIKEIYPNIE